MSMSQAFSFGVGIALRVIINAFCAQNDKLAGALSGIWDGIVSYGAWRTDRILEPLVLVEIVAGVCFDALFHRSPTRLVALALGGALGVLLSDTAAPHTLWDDFGENMQGKLRALDIKDDLDVPDVLSEFSDDVTSIYEEYTISRRSRKMTTAEWIAAQRKARSSKSTSRRASASMNISTDLDKSLLLSGFDTQTQITTQTQSTRARRDKELLATMTPLPAPSVAKSMDINIDIQAPSSLSRLSSPTLRTKVEAENQSVREIEETRTGISKVSSAPNSTTSSDHTARRKSPSVRPESGHPPADRPSFIPSSPDRAGTSEARDIHLISSDSSEHSTARKPDLPSPESNYSAVNHGSFLPLVPPRVGGTRAPTVFSSRDSHIHSLPRKSPVVFPAPSTNRSAADLPSFVPFTSDGDLRARMTRSRASTRRTEHIAEELAEPSITRTQGRRSTIRSKSSTRPASSPAERGQTPTGSAIRSEISGRMYSERHVSPAPEVIIDYSGDTTRIYIPPPAETGINVRIVPRIDEDQQQSPEERSIVDHLSDEQRSQPISKNAAHNHAMLAAPHSIGSFPDFDTVPPDEERSADEAQRSRASRAEMSSDPQPPSIFKLRTAWRDSAPPASPSTDYGGRIAESDDPLPVFVYENMALPSEFHVTRSRSNSSSSQRPLLRKSHSVASIRSHEDLNTLELDMRGDGNIASGNAEVAETPSVEWFGPPKAHNDPGGHIAASDDRHEGPLSVPRLQTSQQSLTYVSSATGDESILSRGPKTSILSRAQQLRQQANDMETRCSALRERRREAQQQGRNTLAFTLGCELEDAEDLARKLHRKAERRFYSAHNAVQDTDKIDVHRLKVLEALRTTERALYDVQRKGGSKLTVIVGRGRHSARGIPVLKNAIIDKMTKKHHFDVKIDDTNPGLIHIFLSSNS